MKRLTRWMLSVVALSFGVGGGLIALATPARAGLLPVAVTVTPQAGHYRWTYNIVLPTDSQLRAGDYFTIYDFAGFIPNSNHQPADWEFSTSPVGPVPDGVIPDDDATLPNLTWRYTGATITTGQTGLGNFWAVSPFGESRDSFFTAKTHRTSDGAVDTNITDTVVPVPTAVPVPNPVPEPGTLALALLGLPVVGLLRRRQSR